MVREMNPESAERLRRVVNRLARYLNADATAEGLTPTQASVLGVVAGRGPIALADVVHAEGLNPTMASRVVSKLTALGLLTRDAPVGDQRFITVSATQRGRDLHRRLKQDRARSVARLVAQLDPTTRQQVEASLPAFEALADLANSAASAARSASS